MTTTPPRAGRTKRVMIVSPFVPSERASHGAGIAIAGMICALAERHEIALVYFSGPDEPSLDPTIASKLHMVVEVPRPPLERGVIATVRLVGRLMLGHPMWVQKWSSTEMSCAIREVLHTWKPDVVHFELTVMAPYIRDVPRDRALRLLTIHDPAVPAAVAQSRRQRGLLRVLHMLDVAAWFLTERAAMRSADVVVAFTDVDRQRLARHAGSTPIAIIALGSTVPDHDEHASAVEPSTVLFVGSNTHPPNIDAAERLTSSILPRLAERVPDAHLFIVGTEPQWRPASPQPFRLTVTGWVPDIDPYVRRAAVVVAPLRLGGGMRVKVLEALSAGKALVASSMALAGLDPHLDGAAVCADTDDEIVAALTKILTDPDTRTDLERRARQWAVAELDWPTRVDMYERVYDRATALAARPSTGRRATAPSGEPSR